MGVMGVRWEYDGEYIRTCLVLVKLSELGLVGLMGLVGFFSGSSYYSCIVLVCDRGNSVLQRFNEGLLYGQVDYRS